MRAYGVCIVLATAGLVASCTLTTDLAGLTSGPSDEAGLPDGSRAPDGADITDARAVDADAASAAETSASDADASDCPGNAGPVAIRVGAAPNTFCIDATEVTNAQYRAFLAAKGSDVGGQPVTCTWNTSYLPGVWPVPPTLDGFPVVTVDWCDAQAYCAWAGKRMCGQIGGGPVDTMNQNPLFSQWMDACTNGGQSAFPYGASYDAATCNTGTGVIGAVESKTACVGGFSGLFDMSGSVEEWEDACTPNNNDPTHATDLCARRGGSFNDGANTANYACSSSLLNSRKALDSDAGIRCCSP